MKNYTITNSFSKALFACMLLMTFYITSCKKKTTVAAQDNFLKGTWVYTNGAETYYDGTSTSSAGTKVPNNNTGFNFVVGENYWENLQASSATTWNLKHILRTNGGVKRYSDATFTKVDANTIQANISTFGTEKLVRKP